jgi:hypothetical protein
MDEYLKTVKLYNQLCYDRSHHSFWSDNLQEGTVHLKSKIAWQNFYSYLNNSDHEYSSLIKPSIGDSIDDNTIGNIYETDTHEYQYKTILNGNVTIIQVTPEVENKM